MLDVHFALLGSDQGGINLKALKEQEVLVYCSCIALYIFCYIGTYRNTKQREWGPILGNILPEGSGLFGAVQGLDVRFNRHHQFGNVGVLGA